MILLGGGVCNFLAFQWNKSRPRRGGPGGRGVYVDCRFKKKIKNFRLSYKFDKNIFIFCCHIGYSYYD